MNVILRLFTIVLIFTPMAAIAQNAILDEDVENSAVILAYHRVGEDNQPDTNIKIEQFKSHLDEILSEGYKVLAVKDILAAIKENTTLPEKTIGITFEGGFKSAYKNAMIPLLENNLPFTVFYASDKADAHYEQFLNWDDLKKIEENPLVDLGILPATYSRIFDKSPSDIRAEMNKARISYRDHFGKEPQYFAYTFGEYSSKFKEIVKEQGFDAAFALQSGAVGDGADFMALPRFSLTQSHGSIDRFRLVAQSKPFYISNITPNDAILRSSKPSIGFSVSDRLSGQLDKLSCFISELGQVKTEIIGEKRVELRLNKNINSDRVRVNCTLPVIENGQNTDNWRWLGMLMVRRENNLESTETQAPAADDTPKNTTSSEEIPEKTTSANTPEMSARIRSPEETSPMPAETQGKAPDKIEDKVENKAEEPTIEKSKVIDAFEDMNIPTITLEPSSSSVLLSPEDKIEPPPPSAQ